MSPQEKASQVLTFIVNYFDKMPPVSRVTFEDLIPYVCKECSHLSQSIVRSYIQEVLKNRKDFVVQRGRGICKLAIPLKEFDVEAFCKDSDPPPANGEVT